MTGARSAAARAQLPPDGQPSRGSLAGDAQPPCPDAADRSEMELLYRAEAPGLTRALAWRIGCREEALDVVQEAFSRFLGLGPSRSAAIERPEAYLRRIGRNLLRDRGKSDARRSAQLHVVVDEDRLAGPDQQQLLETRDMLRRLEAAMLKLKPRTREIFMAHRLDGMSYAEIADRTGLSIKGVEKQMSKAIAQIDRLLDRA